MSGMPLLLISLLLVAGSVAAMFVWANAMHADDAIAPEGPQRFVDLAVFLALQMSRTDNHLQEEEIAAIEGFLDRESTVEGDPKQIVARMLKHPATDADTKAAAREVAKLPGDREREFVLRLLASVVLSDGAVDPGEARFFHRVAKRLGYSVEAAQRSFGVAPPEEEPG